MTPSAALLRPTLWQEHATIAVLHWFVSEVQPCQPSESPALTLLLKEGQYDKGGQDKVCTPCRLLYFPLPPCPPRATQGLTKPRGWTASGWHSAFPVHCLCPSHHFAAHLGWTVHSSIPAAALSGPGDFSWETRWVILPQCGELPNSSVSSGVLYLLPECCPFSEFLGAHRGPGRYCLVMVSLFYARASDGIVASPVLHRPTSFHNWISTDHSAGFKGYFFGFLFF